MSDIGNAGDGDVRLSSIGTARETESIAGAEKSEAISDADGAIKPEAMTVDAACSSLFQLVNDNTAVGEEELQCSNAAVQ
ncbi:hypothetical protein FCV25MIE_09163 [Fagus crenata]